MVIQTTLFRGRQWAQARFTEVFVFVREGLTEDKNGVPVTGDVILYENVSGRLKALTAALSDTETGGRLVAVQQRSAHVKVGATPDVREGDFIIVASSTVDPGLVGRRFRVGGIPDSGQVTAWRYPVEEVS